MVIALAELWPEVTDKNLAPNHCILAARVAVEVGTYFGVPITARSTKVAVFNKVARDWIGKPMKDWPEEAWSVGIGGKGVEGPGYNGHVITESEHWIIDLATGQFTRPTKQLDIGPTLVVRKDPDTTPESMLTVIVNDCQVSYLPDDDESWKRAPDWKNRMNWTAETGAMIRLMKELMLA